MKEKIKMIALGLFVTLMASSCSEEETRIADTTANKNKDGQAAQFGKKLENPYSVANMKIALGNLKGSGSKLATTDLEIKATHLYLKFIPKNQKELELLKSDSTVVFYDYPLDYEISVKGEHYRDPKVNKSYPNPQYCSLRIDSPLNKSNSFNNIERVKIEELFIPDEDFDTNESEKNIKSASQKTKILNGKEVSDDFVTALVNESLRLTNNLKTSTQQNKTAKTMFLKWRPKGRIRSWDTSLEKYINIEGLVVKARSWFTTYQGITNQDGYYSCNGEFITGANYSFEWETEEFKIILPGELSTISFDGPLERGDWNLDIKENEKQTYYATIFNAAHYYYNKDIDGLRRPPVDAKNYMYTADKMRFTANTDYQNLKTTKVKDGLPYLEIYRYRIETFKKPSAITFGDVIYKLSVSTHYYLSVKDIVKFFNMDQILKKTYSYGVQKLLTKKVYGDKFQQPLYIRGYITGIIDDMIDPVKITNSYKYCTIEVNYDPYFKEPEIFTLQKSYNDEVERYTMRELEDALVNARKWNDWKNNIINMHNNGTESKLQQAFDYWNSK